MAKSIAEACLRFTGLFEAELLTELLLRFWHHPLADNADFRSGLLEAAADVLRASAGGERLFEDLDPQNVNFVAAIWHVESVSITESGEMTSSERELRNQWLDSLLKALPSCFCNPDFLN
jgi:hypothetical protein